MEQGESDDVAPWTATGLDRLRQAADVLVDAIRTHVSDVAAAAEVTDADKVLVAGNHLLPSLLTYADAQFDYAGTAFPLGVVYELVDDEEDHETDNETGEFPVAGVTILRRTDYVVTNEASLMAAARESRRRSWGEADSEGTAGDVTHVGEALYQIAHADGWDALDQVDGLQPTGAVVLVQASEELLGNDPDEWPQEDLFDFDDDRLLYRQDDVHFG